MNFSRQGFPVPRISGASNQRTKVYSILKLYKMILSRRFLNALIPHRSPSVIINVVVDLGLLLLVSGSWPHLLRLTLGPEPSFVSLLPLFSFPLRLLSRALYILSCCCSFTLLYLKGYWHFPFPSACFSGVGSSGTGFGRCLGVCLPAVPTIPVLKGSLPFLLVSGRDLLPLHLLLCHQQCW